MTRLRRDDALARVKSESLDGRRVDERLGPRDPLTTKGKGKGLGGVLVLGAVVALRVDGEGGAGEVGLGDVGGEEGEGRAVDDDVSTRLGGPWGNGLPGVDDSRGSASELRVAGIEVDGDTPVGELYEPHNHECF